MKAETATIQLPRTVLETGADKDIEFEGNLADYLPGINRVIRTGANIIPEETVISGTKAEVKGKAIFSLLYESDYKGKLKSEKFTTDFSQRFDIGELPDGQCFPSVSCRCSYVGCKTLNPRRFVLKCRADIRLDLKSMQNIATISVADYKDAFFKSETHSFLAPHPVLRKDFNVEESFTLEGMPPVAEIIYAALQFSTAEANLSDGSVLVRCNGVFKCLYEEEEGSVKLLERSFPAAFTIDDEIISDDCKVLTDIICGNCEVLKEQDNYGENRIVSMAATAIVNVNIKKKQELTTPIDMFFESYECVSKTEQLTYENTELLPKHRFTIEKIFEMPDMIFESCVDTNGELYITEAIADGKGINIKGNCTLNILGNNGNGFFANDVNIPFNEYIPISGIDKDCKIKFTEKSVNAIAEITGNGKINIRATADVCGIYCKKNSINAITAAEINKRESVEGDRKPIIIYYPVMGETAWEIGKRYYKNPKTVITGNDDIFDKDGTVVKRDAVLYI